MARIFIVFSLLFCCGLSAASEIAGQVVSVSGRVLIRNEDEPNPKMTQLKPGDKFTAGAVINTSSDGVAKLLMTDKSILELNASTLFKVKEYQLRQKEDRQVDLTLSYGKIRAQVNTPVGNKGKFKLKTPSATMGVRGTEFIVASDISEVPVAKSPGSASQAAGAPKAAGEAPKATMNKTQITVVQGKVEVSNQQTPTKPPVALTEGTQMTTVSVEKATLPAGEVAAPVKIEEPKIVKLSTVELAAVRQDAKQEDKTFIQAVAVDTSGGGGSSNQGSSTMAAMSGDFTLPSDYVPSADSLNIPGTFSSLELFIQSTAPVNTTVASTATIHVTFVR